MAKTPIGFSVRREDPEQPETILEHTVEMTIKIKLAEPPGHTAEYTVTGQPDSDPTDNLQVYGVLVRVLNEVTAQVLSGELHRSTDEILGQNTRRDLASIRFRLGWD
jgi:hypothetical protein